MTITFVTTPTRTGTIVNNGTVVGDQREVTTVASKQCNTARVGVTGVFTPPVTG